MKEMRLGEKEKPSSRLWRGYRKIWVVLFVFSMLVLGITFLTGYRPTESVWDGNTWTNRSLHLKFSMPEGWTDWSASVVDDDPDMARYGLMAGNASNGVYASVGMVRTTINASPAAEMDAFIEDNETDYGWQFDGRGRRELAGKTYEYVHIEKNNGYEQHFLIRHDGTYLIVVTTGGPKGMADYLLLLDNFSRF